MKWQRESGRERESYITLGGDLLGDHEEGRRKKTGRYWFTPSPLHPQISHLLTVFSPLWFAVTALETLLSIHGCVMVGRAVRVWQVVLYRGIRRKQSACYDADQWVGATVVASSRTGTLNTMQIYTHQNQMQERPVKLQSSMPVFSVFLSNNHTPLMFPQSLSKHWVSSAVCTDTRLLPLSGRVQTNTCICTSTYKHVYTQHTHTLIQTPFLHLFRLTIKLDLLYSFTSKSY